MPRCSSGGCYLTSKRGYATLQRSSSQLQPDFRCLASHPVCVVHSGNTPMFVLRSRAYTLRRSFSGPPLAGTRSGQRVLGARENPVALRTHRYARRSPRGQARPAAETECSRLGAACITRRGPASFREDSRTVLAHGLTAVVDLPRHTIRRAAADRSGVKETKNGRDAARRGLLRVRHVVSGVARVSIGFPHHTPGSWHAFSSVVGVLPCDQGSRRAVLDVRFLVQSS
ncbi:hypothetical protein BD414DRAFT_38970 [Trametes punicea]|nr:hypothetical protein BD414DRAFT_38970 [Trametes punicea]